jgi:signal transduction histidine kinase
LEDLVKAKGLELIVDLDGSRARMNAYLADILLNNLLVNAVRHNLDGGRIMIRLQAGELSVGNTGPPLSFDAENLFDRFTKGQHSDGTGLGLAIVRQICDNYGFGLSYRYEEAMHSIKLRFLLP